jgi:hypothetical protein
MLDPSLAKALPDSKDVLDAMARLILPYGGWSSLRKAELLEKVVEELKRTDIVERLVAQLSDAEREALHQVLAVPRTHDDGSLANARAIGPNDSE